MLSAALCNLYFFKKMAICQFFLQGRCRYGDKCWNEHPGGGRAGGGFNSGSRGPPTPQQQQSRGGGGFGNRVWVNPSQQRGGYVQPSSFGSRDNDQWNRRGDGGGGSDWSGSRGGGGFGRRENIKSSDFSFSQNRFSALDSPSVFNKTERAPAADDDNDRKCEIIQNDMEIWESSGQWGFSTYSSSKNPLSGFADLSPEELRYEYYTLRASGDLKSYINGVNQLLSQWRNRVQELKIMNTTTRAALLRELNSAPQGSSTGFSSTDSAPSFGFGNKSFGASDQLSSFSFAASSSGFGSTSAPPPTGFGSASTAPPSSGFGVSPAPSASSFSFAASDKPSAAATPSGFGSASGFSFSASAGGGFGSIFSSQTPVSSGTTSGFGQPSTSVSAPAASASGVSDCLFSTETSLTAEELDQFKAKRFTLGQIPLKPPPANLLVL